MSRDLGRYLSFFIELMEFLHFKYIANGILTLMPVLIFCTVGCFV